MNKPNNGIVIQFVAATCLLLVSVVSQAAERIIGFTSSVYINRDSSVDVSEELSVRAEGRQIKWGFYRDFPTRYMNEDDRPFSIGFEVISVERDGMPESWFTENRKNGVRIYIGDKDIYLDPGIYEYRIRYRTTRQIGFYSRHDELYWNVTGDQWAFPIDAASARVHLPSDVSESEWKLLAFTGAKGSTETDAVVRRESASVAYFASRRSLVPGEGLTIVVGWPKGIVQQPEFSQLARWWVKDNKDIALNSVGLILLLLYYLSVWHRYGRDPRSSIIIPRYQPPDGLSPAVTRFVYRMGYDQETLTAAIINLAIKGFLIISQREGYGLEKTNKRDKGELSVGESKLLNWLFLNQSKLPVTQGNHRVFSKTSRKFRSYLKREYQEAHFKTNGGLLVPGILLTVLALVGGLLLGGEFRLEVIFMAIWLSAWTYSCYFLLLTRRWLMLSVFGLFEIMAIGLFVSITPIFFLLTMIIFVVVNIVFFHLLQAPTRRGQALMDEIEGFKIYLEVAEADRLNLLNQPEKTPALFEKYLPYALALDVDQQWSETFAEVLAAASKDSQNSWSPGWYHGRDSSTWAPGDIGTNLTSGLIGAISAASVAPGSSSSSGFSSGGSAGGGDAW